jgi:hypothetical protein
VEISAKLIKASPDVTVTTDLVPINQKKGVDLLSAPKVTVKSGINAKIALIKDYTIEGQEAIPVGVELEITAEQTATGITYVARYKLTEFVEFSDPDKKQGPVFRTTTIPFNGSAQDNVPILIEAGNKNDPVARRYIHLTIKNV